MQLFMFRRFRILLILKALHLRLREVIQVEKKFKKKDRSQSFFFGKNIHTFVFLQS